MYTCVCLYISIYIGTLSTWHHLPIACTCMYMQIHIFIKCKCIYRLDVCVYTCVSMFIHVYIYTSHRHAGYSAPLACYVYVYVPADIYIHIMSTYEYFRCVCEYVCICMFREFTSARWVPSTPCLFCVCVCTCVYIYLQNVNVYVCHMGVCILVYISSYIFIYIYTSQWHVGYPAPLACHVYVYVRALYHTRMCMYTYVHVCAYIYMHVCVRMYMYI